MAQRIRARADRERVVLLAEARKEAQITRGEGDASAVAIFADAFGRDPDFFAFYRSMQAYQQGLGGNSDTRMVISPDSEFFRFFNDATGLTMKPAPPNPPGVPAPQPTPEPTAAAPEAKDAAAPDTAMDAAPAAVPEVAKDAGIVAPAADAAATAAGDGNTIK
jgi:membrane protease subunit HflC